MACRGAVTRARMDACLVQPLGGRVIEDARLPEDLAELYEWFMRGGGPVIELCAAIDLVFRAEGLRRWLISNGLVEVSIHEGWPMAEVNFRAAVERVKEISKREQDFMALGPGERSRGILWVAASLTGQVEIGSLRHYVMDLEAPDAKLVAEAMMYAAGCLDGTADPFGDAPNGPGTGPKSEAFERRQFLGL